MPLRSIFQAEFAKNVEFSLIRSYFLSPVKFLHDFERRKWRATIFFCFLFREIFNKAWRHGQGLFAPFLP